MPAAGRRIAAVIPTWNRRDLLERVLRDLARQTVPVQALVVDNASRDGTREMAAAAGIHLVPLERNAGFAAAVNRGIQEALSADSPEWIAIVNNDVELAEDWAAQLLDACDRSAAWFAAPKILSARDATALDGTFDLIARSACAWRAGAGQPADHPEWSRPRPISFAPMTAALFRADLFTRAGALDEDYGSYLEDVDFGLRCALAGCPGVYVPSALARHQGSATLGRWNPATVRRIARNQVLLAAKHFPADWFWALAAGQGLWGAVAARHGALAPYAAGKREGLAWRDDHSAPAVHPRLRSVVQASENEMRELQRATRNRDRYWRIYFALARDRF